MKDKDGFYILKRKEPKQVDIPLPKIVKKKVKPHKPKVKFKKGGWKYSLWEKLKDWKSSPSIRSFHNKQSPDYAIYESDENIPSLLMTAGPIKYGQMKMLKVVDKNAKVLVSCGDEMFMRIPLKAYRKLQKINKMVISYKLTAFNDYEPDIPSDVFERTEVIDTMNSLLQFINQHRQGILGVYEVEALCLGMTSYVFDFKILVLDIDGHVKTYHDDMNGFMRDYHLFPF